MRTMRGTRRRWTNRTRMSKRSMMMRCATQDKGRDAGASTSEEEKREDWNLLGTFSKKRFLAASPTSRVAFSTGAYISVVGLALLIFPSTTFHFVFPRGGVEKPFIRLGGVLCQLFGFYYLGASYGDLASSSQSASQSRKCIRAFYMSTIIGRIYLAAVIPLLCVTCDLSARALLLAVINLLGALSLRRALRMSEA